jgi:ATP-dependent Clp protease ATP-binding subunit ClpA
MALANAEAVRLNHDHLTPAHLLLGLIAEGKCVATEALRVLNVNLERVRDEVRSRMMEGNQSGTFGRRAHSQELRDVINLAIQEARRSGHRYVGTEHLILGLLARGDDLPSQALRQEGVDLSRLREKVLALLRTGVDAEHDLAHSRHGDFEWVHQQELAKAFRSSTFWHTMILAVDSANRLGAGEVEPKHLLMALLRDPGNGIATALKEKGVTEEWIQSRLGG